MNQFLTNHLPDLVVSICPFGCNKKCDGLWINEQTGHRIVCLCTCHERNKQALEMDETPESDVIRSIKSSLKESKKDDQ
ncbi:MAG: hypothetical protein WCF23_13390 [Candidatus Nitrosopolaris sp.]